MAGNRIVVISTKPQSQYSRGTSILHGSRSRASLFEGAKAEGKVVWYTSLSGGSYKALAAAFEAKYPGVGVEVYRAPGSDLALKITQSWPP
jgi:ABC-type glycerol-3-phosphate transport system substrate-binding protein